MKDEPMLLPEDFVVNPSRPIYEQFVEQITARIVRGLLPTGLRLPSVRDFAAGRRVNPTTAARTYQELERMGLIVTYRGQGTFVTNEEAMILEARKVMAKEAVQQFKEMAISLGLSVQEMIELAEQEE
ncbi:GntR family transcriptional regulator [Paenibacillus anaericanus]|uniref:GntR family transcriptional regulator n=1 Tax=Paenibacillus anaericanus TaxID=170367 RepID=A0A433XX62_9BACL|nr:GntR family transcriptional regulator [Paenibacillus anaericanus]RUT39246.1 GntR family transcriptional regulator [Paenibacillus anaericanus]